MREELEKIVLKAISRVLRAETDPVLSFNITYRMQEKEVAVKEAIASLESLTVIPFGQVMVPLEPTDAQLRAAHDGPLMAEEHHLDKNTETYDWLRDMYRAFIGAR